MERYVDPMVEIVRPDGPLRACFEETERLLQQALGHGLFNDLPALERNTRRLRLVQRHALRIFQQCRRELQPLYESLRRSSFIAEGAARALEWLQREGLDGWPATHAIPVRTLRWQHVPSDPALDRALRAVVEHPPEPAPVLPLNREETVPPAYLRQIWLDSLPAAVQSGLPLNDLLGWLVQQYPGRDTADTLAAFTRLIFDPAFVASFQEGPSRGYRTCDGELAAAPVELTSSSAPALSGATGPGDPASAGPGEGAPTAGSFLTLP
jgi:hypothetical protein